MAANINRFSMVSRGARWHFDVAIVLISIVPMLAVAAMAFGGWIDVSKAPVAALWCFALSPLAGYAVLLRYPRTISKIRTYLEEIIRGELPEKIQLVADEDDIASIERSMNMVLNSLRQRLSRVEEEKLLLEGELLQSRKLEAIGTLAGGIAHEVNTPTQCICSNLQFLKSAFDALIEHSRNHSPISGEGDASDTWGPAFVAREIPPCIEQTGAAARRIAATVQAMRSFAAGNNTTEKEPCDLNEAISSTVAVTRNEWKHTCKVVTVLDPALPPVVCHPGEIKQAIMNLLLNGVQAIRDKQSNGAEDGVSDCVEIKTSLNSQTVSISVRDTGCGIPNAMKPRIFEPFFTTRKVGQGIGCGLAVVRSSIVVRHGGSITFDSQPRLGATFTICLPIGTEAGAERQGTAAIGNAKACDARRLTLEEKTEDGGLR